MHQSGGGLLPPNASHVMSSLVCSHHHPWPRRKLPQPLHLWISTWSPSYQVWIWQVMLRQALHKSTRGKDEGGGVVVVVSKGQHWKCTMRSCWQTVMGKLPVLKIESIAFVCLTNVGHHFVYVGGAVCRWSFGSLPRVLRHGPCRVHVLFVYLGGSCSGGCPLYTKYSF